MTDKVDLKGKGYCDSIHRSKRRMRDKVDGQSNEQMGHSSGAVSKTTRRRFMRIGGIVIPGSIFDINAAHPARSSRAGSSYVAYDEVDARRQDNMAVLADQNLDRRQPRWRVTKAFANFWLEEDVDEANALLMDSRIRDAETFDDFHNPQFRLYWVMPEIARMYVMFHENGTRAPLLEAETEEVLRHVLWRFLHTHEWAHFTEAGSPARLVGSENHDWNQKTTILLAAQILKDSAGYASKTPSSGRTLQELHSLAIQHYHDKFDEYLPAAGLWIEGRGGYRTKSLSPIYNLRDLAADDGLKRKVGIYLDLIWLDYALLTLEGVRGGPKSRVPSRFADGKFDDFTHIGRIYFDHDYITTDEVGPHLPQKTVTTATNDYLPPEIAYHLVRNPTDRGSFEYVSRFSGVGESKLRPEEDQREDAFMFNHHINVDENVINYNYVTPDFVTGSFVRDPDRGGPGNSGTILLSSQQRWQGTIFGANPGARIYTGHPDYGGNIHNGFITMQNGPVLIVGEDPRLSSSRDRIGPPRLFVNPFPDVSTDVQGWVFGEIDGAYYALNAVNGSLVPEEDDRFLRPVPDDPRRFRLSEPTTPVVQHFGRAAEFDSRDEFEQRIRTNSLLYRDGVVEYRDADWGEMRFEARFDPTAQNVSPIRFIDGEPLDLNTSEKLFDSPYLKSVGGHDIVTAQFREERRVYDLTSYRSETARGWLANLTKAAIRHSTRRLPEDLRWGIR